MNMNRRTLILGAACFLSAMMLSAADAAKPKSLKVLMIGNSFTASVMRQTPQFAKAAGVTLDIVQCGIGGCPLEKHWANVLKASNPKFKPYSISWSYASDPDRKFRKQANVTEMLTADKWDVVTIQQASGKSFDATSYQPFADNLIAKIKELAPQAEIIIQQTWSWCPYDSRMAKNNLTQQTMHAKLKEAYAAVATKHNLRIIPTGDAVQLFRERLPVNYGTLLTKEEIDALQKPATIDFHGDIVGSSHWGKGRKGRKDADEIKLRMDTAHFNARGQYLQACVWTAALFGIDPTQVTYRPDDVSEADAVLMRTCARDAVAATTSK